MCKLCRKYRVKPAYELLLHGEGELELLPQFEWERAYEATSYIPTPKPAYAPKSSDESAIIKKAILSGTRNENVLTDIIFNKRHPELGGKPLSASQPNFSILSTEWRIIRDTLVRPALQPATAPGPPPVIPSEPAHGTLSLSMLLGALQQKRYIIYQRSYELNIVGVRAYTAQPNSFDDTINFFYKDQSGAWQFKSCAATTDPGTYYLDKPFDPSVGTAILKPEQYVNAYTIGLHRDTYEALVQRGGEVTVIRDPDRDNVLDFGGTEYTGYFGINIHRAKTSGTAQQVDQFSAGCQVFATTADFDFFMTLCKEHAKRYGNKFTYTLLTEDDLD